MIKWALLLFGLLAVIDLVLLYLIYAQWGFWAVMAVTVVAPWLILRLSSAFHRQTLFGTVLAIPARILLWYPGPLTTVLGGLLITPWVKRMFGAWTLRAAQKAIFSGKNPMDSLRISPDMFPRDRGADSSDPAEDTPPSPGPFPFPGTSDGLKRAQGRVVDGSEADASPDGYQIKRQERSQAEVNELERLLSESRLKHQKQQKRKKRLKRRNDSGWNIGSSSGQDGS